MRIGVKLGLAFGFLLFLASALGVMDYRAMSRSAASSTVIAREFLPMNSLGTALTQDLSTISLDMRVFSFTGDPKMFESAHAAILQAEKRIADLTPAAKSFTNVPKIEDVLETAPRLMRDYRASMLATKELSDVVTSAVTRMDATAKDVENSLVELQNSIAGLMRESINLNAPEIIERRYSNLLLINGIMLRIQNVRLLMLKATFSKDLKVFDELAKISAENDRAFVILDKQLQSPQNRENMTRLMADLQRYRTEMGVVRDAWQKNVELGKDRLKLGYGMQAIIGDITRSSLAACSASALESADENDAAVTAMITMLGLVLLLGIIVSVVLTRMITGPIRKNVTFAQAVANGKLDERLDVRGTDEIGQLSDALRWMVDALKARIAEATEKSEQARIKGEEASAAMETAREAQHEAENAKRVGMLTAAERLEGVVSVLSSASEQLRAQLSQAGHGTEEQAARVAETATAMHQMNATVLEVARNAGAASDVTTQTRQRAEEGAKIVQQALRSINSVQEQSLSLKKDMAELGEHTRSISQIMSVISDIADQTNLLALNAAIEAARAGEAGRGFAVVADEVRKLAEKTMASTTDVANAIRAIQQSAEKNMSQVDVTVSRIEEATELAGKSGETLGDIVRMVDNAADQVRAIATASEEQSSSSEQISQAINQINQITATTAETMRESTDAVQNLARQAHELSGLIVEMKRN